MINQFRVQDILRKQLMYMHNSFHLKKQNSQKDKHIHVMIPN
jgi:hypothetical protein